MSLWYEIPEGTRQTREGYWVGALPKKGSHKFFIENEITLVLSAVKTSEEVSQALVDAGVKQVHVPMGMTFRHAEKILESTDSVLPSQCFIHCYHGADRTGSILSFLLCVRHGWSIEDAFYSVLYRSKKDVKALGELLEQAEIHDHRTLEDPSVSFYSYAAVGLVGGLKAHAEGYRTLILSTIRTIRQYTEKENASIRHQSTNR